MLIHEFVNYDGTSFNGITVERVPSSKILGTSLFRGGPTVVD